MNVWRLGAIVAGPVANHISRLCLRQMPHEPRHMGSDNGGGVPVLVAVETKRKFSDGDCLVEKKKQTKKQ